MARPNIIDTKGLGDDVLKLYLEGNSHREIAKRLGIGPDSVLRYINTHKEAKALAIKAESVPDFPSKGKIMVEITQEIAKQKLGFAVGEAEINYLKFKDVDDSKAAYWFSLYQSAIEKLLKASGQYEKAKKMAEQVEIPKIIFEIIPPYSDCPHCGKSL